jgi:hypothetical protein
MNIPFTSYTRFLSLPLRFLPLPFPEKIAEYRENELHNQDVLSHCIKKQANRNFDDLVKRRKWPFSFIPAKANQRSSLAGIQYLRLVASHLDSGFHRSDDFLRIRQFCVAILLTKGKK